MKLPNGNYLEWERKSDDPYAPYWLLRATEMTTASSGSRTTTLYLTDEAMREFALDVMRQGNWKESHVETGVAG